MIFSENLILGAGISGIAAAYELKQQNVHSLILEKNKSWGGLLDNFTINGFRFDKFIHLSFAQDNYVNEIFFKSPLIKHTPLPFNYYKGKWLKHPAQNNLYPLDQAEKDLIINDFKSRKQIDVADIRNYEEWLRVQFGDYFAENFSMIYTEKYWTMQAKDLETRWIGNRLYKPTIEEVENGCNTNLTPNTYYAKEMRYPKSGGYKTFLNPMVDCLNIKTDSSVTSIDLENKEVVINSQHVYKFENLISSLPLPEICSLIKNIPLHVLEASNKLNFTSGYLISLGFSKPEIADKLWFYIYDKDILPARVYSPSLKSPDNAPNGCSSIQAELYFSKKSILNIASEDILEQTIEKFISIGLFCVEDLIVKDIRSEKYANVIFDHFIYDNRKIVIDYLESNQVISVGRFGEWDYFWSDQSMLSGRDGALKLINRFR
ncbi:NAD(P)/FAD-dependent oxidoreductase [Sediminibacterium sp.]|uniref:protoporphyrinogen/coproporphyrinogen oxidase n=1 Tax=Sediminibacterium sp. TaxID=1917865 RepID=UPI00272F0475|nr:NAD(P)-binding protein [Sediminibacterium sp.]MDP2420243.1 NAD(P)-binding protein [Sediminibacterium sp.]